MNQGQKAMDKEIEALRKAMRQARAVSEAHRAIEKARAVKWEVWGWPVLAGPKGVA